FFGIQNPFVPVAFLTGGFFSGLCGYIGMKTATRASNRTAQAASEGLNRGLQVAFRSGAVMGMVVVGFGLLDICLWFLILDKCVYTPGHMADGWSLLGLELVPAGCGAVSNGRGGNAAAGAQSLFSATICSPWSMRSASLITFSTSERMT
ncbi:MAG: sodium/proton-translocating pyrophosphatase, partial [Clostridia bacterium]|nr:sodium/proton-translocating pyrophosphatase [Clostridia bacterium]